VLGEGDDLSLDHIEGATTIDIDLEGLVGVLVELAVGPDEAGANQTDRGTAGVTRGEDKAIPLVLQSPSRAGLGVLDDVVGQIDDHVGEKVHLVYYLIDQHHAERIDEDNVLTHKMLLTVNVFLRGLHAPAIEKTTYAAGLPSMSRRAEIMASSRLA
jgi:hypothetical protein